MSTSTTYLVDGRLVEIRVGYSQAPPAFFSNPSLDSFINLSQRLHWGACMPSARLLMRIGKRVSMKMKKCMMRRTEGSRSSASISTTAGDAIINFLIF